MQTQFKEAIAYAKARNIVLPAQYYKEENKSLRNTTFSVAGIDNARILEAVLNSLADNIETGKTFANWQEKIKEKGLLPFSKNRLDVIYRTNLQGAYMAGHYENLYNSDVVEYLMYDAINDGRARKTHLAWDGAIFPKTHPFWQTHLPPCGYRCRCSVIGLSKNQAVKRELAKPKDQRTKAYTEYPQADDGWDYDRSRGGIEKGISKAFKQAKDDLNKAQKRFNKASNLKVNLLQSLLSWLIAGLAKF